MTIRKMVLLGPDQLDALTHLPEIRRSGRITQLPARYGKEKLLLSSESDVMENPTSYQDALGRSDPQKWRDAMNEEVLTIDQKEVWKLTELQKGVKVIAIRWVYQVKKDANGFIERYKARLVVIEFSQKLGIDFGEIYVPVIKYETLGIVLALTGNYRLKLLQIDVNSAFLNGDSQEDYVSLSPKV